MIISSKFLSLRVKENLNREHLAARLNVSASAIQDLETCPNHNPHINMLLKYRKYFKVELKELVKMDDVDLGDAV